MSYPIRNAALAGLAAGALLATGDLAHARVPTESAVGAVREAATALPGHPQDYDPLIAAVGEARFVLLGESTHGTKDYYEERGRIAERLVAERGFGAVVIEADGLEV